MFTTRLSTHRRNNIVFRHWTRCKGRDKLSRRSSNHTHMIWFHIRCSSSRLTRCFTRHSRVKPRWSSRLFGDILLHRRFLLPSTPCGGYTSIRHTGRTKLWRRSRNSFRCRLRLCTLFQNHCRLMRGWIAWFRGTT